MELVSRIATVPSPYLYAAKTEAASADFERLASQRSVINPVFSTSRSISLRTHAAPAGLTHEDYSNVNECIDTPLRKRFPAMDLLVKWMLRTLGGSHLGRIQLVALLPGGEVAPHIDKGTYFDLHGRYHVPLITNDQVLFNDGAAERAHMAVGGLYRLANLRTHGVRNESDQRRVHLIVDIQVGEHQ